MKPKLSLLLLISLIYVGCSNEDSSLPSKEIKGSLFVTVKDVKGLPVNDAAIAIGELTATTNEDGTYFFTQVTLSGDDFLQVEKAGFFKGSRRFRTIEAHTQFLSITLLPEEEVGNFNSTQSATISIDAHSKLTFPDHSVTRADGSPYNGNVHVLASPIYGDDPQLSQKMPGSLTGVNESGTKVALGSFGMLAVELQADNGDVLEIASGQTVEMRLAIADKQLGQAPSTIPLWYFDEVKGYWVQEGEATRQGNVYVAQLPHFSYWNCDDTFELINWQARFAYSDGTPAQNVEICVTIKSLNDQRCEYTNADGLVSGGIAANQVLELNVRNACGHTVLTDEIGPFSDDVTMETRTLASIAEDYATISGTALQCDGSPLTKGFVRVRTTKGDFIFPVEDAEGHYEGGYVYCAGDVVTLQVYDVVHALVSLPQVITFDRQLTGVSVKACDQVDEFIRYKITGFSPEYIYYVLDLDISNITLITSVDSIGVKGKFGWSFDGVTTGQYKGYTIFGNQINLPNGQTGNVVKMDVNVTEYGGHGEYIRGNLSGRINVGGNGAGGSGDSDFVGSFSVKRQ